MITDDELLLYHFQDGLDPERTEAIRRALADDLVLRARLEKLQAQLLQMAMPQLPLPTVLHARLSRRLAQVADNSQTEQRPRFPWQPAFAACALLLLGVLIGVRWRDAPVPKTVVEVPIAPSAKSSDSAVDGSKESYAHTADLNLLETERVLASVTRVAPKERAEILASLIESNRFHARLAQRAGETELARVLRAFEPVLESMAQPGTSSDAIAAGSAQLDFELEIMQTKRKVSASKHSRTL